MTLADLSIKRPVFAWMLMLGLMLFGGVAFMRLGISQLPDVDFPVVTVCVTLEGAAPEVIETQIVDIIEDSVMTIQGIREVSSNSRLGRGCVTVEFELTRDIDVALQEIQTKVAQAQRRLPREIDPPVFEKSNPEDQPIMWVALMSDGDIRSLMRYTSDYLKNQVATVAGVGDVFLGGYVDPNLRVWLDASKMQQREITVQDVMQAINNEHLETPAGTMTTPTQELNLRVLGEASSVQEFNRMVIPQRSGAPIWGKIRIGDVGSVEAGLSDLQRYSRQLGKTAVGLGIKKQRGANAVQVARAVKAKIATLQDKLPSGMTMKIIFDFTQFIEESTHELVFVLILSAILTSLVCWLFLGSFSSTMNVLLAIPTSVIGTFLLLYFLGFTLNTFTLLALTLAIGIVVDDAIMVLENIVRYREQGKSRMDAASIGAREITFAALASTVAILAIFMPVIFMEGVIGKFFYQFGVTISFAVLLSLLEALTLTPMRCSQFLDVNHEYRLTRHVNATMQRLSEFYRRSLVFALNHRFMVVSVAILLFAGSLYFAKLVKKEFVPAQDQGRIMVRVQTPVGSNLNATDQVVRQMEAFLSQRPDVRTYYAAVGGFGGSEVNTAMLFITMHPKSQRPIIPPAKHRPTQQELMAVLRKEFNKIPGVERAIIQDLSLSGFTSKRGFPVEFTLHGANWDTLGQLSETMLKKMQDTGLMVDVDSDYSVGMPEVSIQPNRERAAERGVSISSIATTINAMMGGVRVGSYTEDGKRYDIRVRLRQQDRSQQADIDKLWVRNNRGEVIRLSEVVDLKTQPALLSITRKNRERVIRLFANVAPGKSQAEATKAVTALEKELPDGYRLQLAGSSETMQQSFSSLMTALLLGILVSYMVLGSQFNSFVHPLSVLLSLPFSISGAFMALYFGQQSLNIYSFIGLILLTGIVKKNSIMLVDFTNESRRRGQPPMAALLEACPVRLRPILMTSFSTIAAAIPPALGFGPGAETRIPMALVVIGGVLVSTLFTLYVVPVVYSLLVRFESKRHAI